MSSDRSAKTKYPIHPNVLVKLHGCQNTHELHFTLLKVFIQFLSDNETEQIRETFQSIDEDHSGTIDVQELTEAFLEPKKQYEKEK